MMHLEHGSLMDRVLALMDRVLGTAYLVDAMESWREIAQTEDAPDDIRVEAALYARAIRAEGGLPRGNW